MSGVDIKWPDAFITPDAPYYPDDTPEKRERLALKDQLTGAGNYLLLAFSDQRVTEKFERGMFRLSEFTGVLTIEEVVDKYFRDMRDATVERNEAAILINEACEIDFKRSRRQPRSRSLVKIIGAAALFSVGCFLGAWAWTIWN